VLFGIAGWMASPTEAARSVRRTSAPVLRDHVAYVYAALAIVIGLYFLSASVHNLRSFLTTLAIGGLAAFGVHELRKQAVEEFPEAQLSDSFGRTRERVAGAVRSANLGERASKLRLPEVRMPGGGKTAGAEAEQPAPPADETDARIARLERLGALHEKGILTDAELAAEKARVLNTGETAS